MLNRRRETPRRKKTQTQLSKANLTDHKQDRSTHQPVFVIDKDGTQPEAEKLFLL